MLQGECRQEESLLDATPSATQRIIVQQQQQQ
jgi:hypothetical protein